MALAAAAFEHKEVRCSVVTWELVNDKAASAPGHDAHAQMNAYMHAARGHTGRFAVAACCLALVVLGVALNSFIGKALANSG